MTIIPRQRPEITYGTTEKISVGCGITLYITINEDKQGLCEVFVEAGKSGGCITSYAEALGRLVSLALRSSVDPLEIIKQLAAIRCPAPIFSKDGQIFSCADAVAKSLEHKLNITHEHTNITISDTGLAPVCPECEALLIMESGCCVCSNPSCGWTLCS